MSLPDPTPHAETAEVEARYARRGSAPDWRYNAVNPSVWQSLQERERAVLRLWRRLGWTDLSHKRLVEVGCGTGTNLIDMLRHGFLAENLSGIELIESRWEAARQRLPAALHLACGDASRAALADASVDVVLQATVFSSLLDDAFQQRLADTLWRWVKPGGGVLWYDFTVDNPRNPDVRGVPLSRVRALFPQGRVRAWRVTLAPPIARAVTRLHPSLYTFFNLCPALRTHALAWISKS